jgi:pimeloyl-ACP methyl ester carboxylesterase
MKLFYRKLGNGEPLVIAHGMYGMSDNWMSAAKMLSENFEVIVPDMRNHGQSSWADSHTYENLAGDLTELLSEFSLENAFFIGHSMGGKAVMKLALENPNLVRKLIVADVAPKNYLYFEEKSGFDHFEILDLLRNIDFQKIKSRKDAEFFLAEKVWDEKIRQFVLKNISREKDGSLGLKLNAAALFENLPKIAGEVFAENGQTFDREVLFVKGEKSNYICKEDHELILKLFPAAHFITVKNAGHWLHAEQPEVFTGIARKFLI